MDKRAGAGVYYGRSSMFGFDIGEYESAEWVDRKFSTGTNDHDATGLADYAEYSMYDDEGLLTCFYTEGILEGWPDSPCLEKAVEMKFFYREDGTLERKECYYNSRMFGTTRQVETYNYDAHERMVYVNAYITHGSLEDYYIYVGAAKRPSYRLTVDHDFGNASAQGFFKY